MRWLALPVSLTVALAGFLVLVPLRAEVPTTKIDFNRDIRPILSENCFACHGPDEQQRKGDLRLDSKKGVLEDRGGYHIVVPGDVKKSELLARITSKQPGEMMPPPRTNKKLTQEQITLMQRWIEQGAPWEEHWAFVTPTRPPLPPVQKKPWVRNPVDQFILARLEKEGLQPSPEAERHTLIRRVTLDLTGLPPTPAEVEAFVQDTSPDAYEKVVDRLLASQRFGEHLARYWLDSARYGDTHGLHLDNYREFWPYRDWVINAFNRNLPYNQFIIEQLAGDLLPNPTQEQLIASGFNRAHVTTSEGGSIAEEVFVRNVVDRVETTGTVFMGLTVGCAVCHDHKYDPISQKEFYQLFAYFNSLNMNPLDGNAKAHAPVLPVPTPEQKQQRDEYQRQLAQTEQEMAAKLASIKYVEPAKPSQPKLPEPREIVWIDDYLPPGAQPAPASWQWVSASDKAPVLSGQRASTRTVAALKVDQHFFSGAKEPLTIGTGDRLFAYVYLDVKNPPKEIMLQFNDGRWEHRATWGGDHIPWGQKNSPSRRHVGPLPKAGEWVRLEVAAEQVGLKPGAKVNGWAFTQFGGTVHWDKAGLLQMPDPARPHFASLAQWEEFQRKLPKSTLPAPIQAVLKVEAAKRSPAQVKQLTVYFVEHVYVGTRAFFQPLHRKVADLKQKISNLEKQYATTLISKETDQPRSAYFLKRGQYDQRGEQVQRRTPDALPPMAKDLPNNRLGFAKWLVNPEHPLTARVAVNRFWQQLFGVGIVKTQEDFGNQGEAPVHPELLDWLAVEFRETGWDVKRLLKLLVTSNAYRQASRVTPELYERDPDNRLLARGPRLRLDAEVIRDQALALGGLLVHQLGGPGVRPPQPPGIWESVAYVGSNTMNFRQDKGADKVFRRSLYTFWKRTAPPPQMTTFDAPSREACRVRRERTNTPMQALLLMNETQCVEAARHLAQRLLKEGGPTPQTRMAFLFQLATARAPGAVESQELLAAYQDFHAEFQANPKSAQQLIQVGETPPDSSLDPVELAAWTMVANVVLNLDEVVTKN